MAWFICNRPVRRDYFEWWWTHPFADDLAACVETNS